MSKVGHEVNYLTNHNNTENNVTSPRTNRHKFFGTDVSETLRFTSTATIWTGLAIACAAGVAEMIVKSANGVFANFAGNLLFLPFAAVLVFLVSVPVVFLATKATRRRRETKTHLANCVSVSATLSCTAVGIVLTQPWRANHTSQRHDVWQLIGLFWVFALPTAIYSAFRVWPIRGQQ